MTISPELAVNTGQIVRVGELNLPFGPEEEAGKSMILSVVSVKDYDDRQMWMPVLLDDEEQLSGLLGQNEDSMDSCPPAGSLNEKQKDDIKTLINDYKIPWPMAIHICLNGLGDLNWQDGQEPKPNTPIPAMFTIRSRPGAGKSLALAIADKMKASDAIVWTINADPWARVGTRITDYADLVDVMDVAATNKSILRLREGGEKLSKARGTVRQIMDGLSKGLLTSEDRPDVVALDTSGHDGERSDDIVDMIAYFCFEPIVGDDMSSQVLIVKTIDALKYLSKHKGELDREVVKLLE